MVQMIINIIMIQMLNSGVMGVGVGVGCSVLIAVGFTVGCCVGLAVMFGSSVGLAVTSGDGEACVVGVGVGEAVGVVAELPKFQPALGSTSKQKHEGKKATANKTVKNISIMLFFIFQSAYTS
jgi:hypothetical protein